MNQNLSGSEFAVTVANTLGQKLENPELVAFLYETCRDNGSFSSFKDLALYAKSVQKLARLLSNAQVGADTDTKNKVRAELEDLLKKFADLIKLIVSKRPDEERSEIRTNFFVPTAGSLTDLRSQLNDFARIKDYLLDERDENLDGQHR